MAVRKPGIHGAYPSEHRPIGVVVEVSVGLSMWGVDQGVKYQPEQGQFITRLGGHADQWSRLEVKVKRTLSKLLNGHDGVVHSDQEMESIAPRRSFYTLLCERSLIAAPPLFSCNN